MSFSISSAVTETEIIRRYCAEQNLEPVERAALKFLHMRARVMQTIELSEILDVDDELTAEIAAFYPETGEAIKRMQENPGYKQKMYDFYLRTIRPVIADAL